MGHLWRGGKLMTGVLGAIVATGGSAPSVSIAPSPLYDSRTGGGSITSSIATATATGGAGGYSYAWTYVSGDALTVSSPAASSTTFSTTLLSGQTKTAVYRCTVTDAASATGFDDLTVTLESIL